MNDKNDKNDDLIEKLTGMVSRRRILASLSAGAVALASSLLGKAKAGGVGAAFAMYHCCDLCKPNDPSCSGCACTFSWNCFEHPGGPCRVWKCTNCHTNTNCGSGCNNVKCSKGELVALGC